MGALEGCLMLQLEVAVDEVPRHSVDAPRVVPAAVVCPVAQDVAAYHTLALGAICQVKPEVESGGGGGRMRSEGRGQGAGKARARHVLQDGQADAHKAACT